MSVREREVLLEEDIEKTGTGGKRKLERKLKEKREVNHFDLLAVISACVPADKAIQYFL